MIYERLWRKQEIVFDFLIKNTREMTIEEVNYSWKNLPLSISYLLLAVDEQKFELIF